MEQAAQNSNWILLAGGDDSDEECWADRIQQLRRHEQKLPRIKPFVSAPFRHVFDVENARQEIERYGTPPGLIIVDAKPPPTPGRKKSGAAVVDLLNWLAEHAPVPVLVVTENPSEAVQRCVLERPERLMWSNEIGKKRDGGADLALVLDSVAAATQRRRLVIEVAEKAVRYRIQFGPHEFKSPEMPYKRQSDIESLLIRVAKFSPYLDNQKVADWLESLSEMGRQAFDVMVAETVGPPIATLIQRARDQDGVLPGDGLAWMDLRFDFNVSDRQSAAFFSLPFELSCNTNLTASDRRYLCQRIPMARRLHIDGMDSASDWSQPEPRPAAPLRLLFIGANFSGTISFQPEDGNDDMPNVTLPPLESVADELANLQTLAKRLDGRLVVEDVPPLTGYALQDYLEDKVTGGGYDILHFSGHSHSIRDSTMLVLPGEEEGEGLQLSIRLVGRWMKAGNCKLLVLSSCSGASVRTALEVMRAGAMGVLAFRWQVEEKTCARFIRRFYAAYFDASNTQGFAEAYRRACAGSHDESRGSPTWASALAVVRD
ncbi:CHAT domain-containing protein [Achromobacter insolitus]|uniref:CHAT domain-containing protein n=1 Tax=Achromobacter insolitus TaxID=217204 RepID=UPI0011EB4D79|nr:CHAT domain-containing protein [Achromobacter insolitus]QEK90530.1 CHAT domain-containing protein [Achromobacter insolitus]